MSEKLERKTKTGTVNPFRLHRICGVSFRTTKFIWKGTGLLSLAFLSRVPRKLGPKPSLVLLKSITGLDNSKTESSFSLRVPEKVPKS